MVSLFLIPVRPHTFLTSDLLQWDPTPANLSGKPQSAGVLHDRLKGLYRGPGHFRLLEPWPRLTDTGLIGRHSRFQSQCYQLTLGAQGQTQDTT